MERSTDPPAARQSPETSRWLFSPRADLVAFGGSAVLSMFMLAIGWACGLLEEETPDWTWVTAVLMVDVAHVYATAFRVYLVPEELRRRPWLYGLTPLLGWLLGVAVYSESDALFWRSLAYLAVFHFVRQQYGWVALYRAKAAEKSGWWLDAAAIYAATLWPLLWWHGHLPRAFWWFREFDFAAESAKWAELTQPLYWGILGSYFLRSAYRGCCRRSWSPGKDLVVATTALCWYLGIVALNSDYAFTVTNVFIHGIPYIVLVRMYQDRMSVSAAPDLPATDRPGTDHPETVHPRAVLALDRVQCHETRRPVVTWAKYLGALWVFAYVEEFFWHRGVWRERLWLFGATWSSEHTQAWEGLQTWLVPLLAVPQLTHYVLDGFLWKRRSNPRFADWLPRLPYRLRGTN